jgi:hypothetical protein
MKSCPTSVALSEPPFEKATPGQEEKSGSKSRQDKSAKHSPKLVMEYPELYHLINLTIAASEETVAVQG